MVFEEGAEPLFLTEGYEVPKKETFPVTLTFAQLKGMMNLPSGAEIVSFSINGRGWDDDEEGCLVFEVAPPSSMRIITGAPRK